MRAIGSTLTRLVRHSNMENSMPYNAGELLVKGGLVRPAQLAQAYQLRAREGGSVGECLIRTGALDEQSIADFYHRRLMVPRVGRSRLARVSPQLAALVPADMAAEFRVLPVETDNEGGLLLAMADPADNHAVDEVAFF